MSDDAGKVVQCADCGIPLNEGTARCFTVCDACWDRHHKRAPAPDAHVRERVCTCGSVGHPRKCDYHGPTFYEWHVAGLALNAAVGYDEMNREEIYAAIDRYDDAVLEVLKAERARARAEAVAQERERVEEAVAVLCASLQHVIDLEDEANPVPKQPRLHPDDDEAGG